MTTPELSSLEKAAFFDLQGANVKILMEPMEGVAAPLMEVEKDLDCKSKSQRLRDVLFVLWSKHKDGEFEEFYNRKMERFIDHVKQKIDEKVEI